MKDAMAAGSVLFLAAVVMTFPQLTQVYKSVNLHHGFAASFFKFAVLATAGEMAALRINSGTYYAKGFGLIPRAMVWGLLGIFTQLGFIIFSNGIPAVWSSLHVAPEQVFAATGINGWRIAGAFSASLALNGIFAPVLFVIHSISDEHIRRCDGKLKLFFKPVPVRDILVHLNWSALWDFGIKRSIPLFWLPAHTITFLLPGEYRILMAAMLSFFLGVILAFIRMDGVDLSRMAASVLETVSKATGGTAFLGQIRGDHVYMVARHDYKKSNLVSINIGQRFPLHYGAHGKVIAAYLPDAQRPAALAEYQKAMRSFGEPLDMDALASDLKLCRNRGFAIDRSRNFPQFNVISAPVLGKGSKILGCIIALGAFDESENMRMGLCVQSGALSLMAKIAA